MSVAENISRYWLAEDHEGEAFAEILARGGGAMPHNDDLSIEAWQTLVAVVVDEMFRIKYARAHRMSLGGDLSDLDDRMRDLHEANEWLHRRDPS